VSHRHQVQRHLVGEGPELTDAEIVRGVDRQPEVPCSFGGGAQPTDLDGPPLAAERFDEAAAIELDTGGPGRGGQLDPLRIRIAEDRYGGSRLQPAHRGAQARLVVPSAPAPLRRELSRVERGDDEGADPARRPHEVEDVVAEVAAHAQLQRAGAHLAHPRERQHVRGRDVPSIGPRVDQHRLATGRGERRGHGAGIGDAATPRGAQQRHLVQSDAQPGHRRGQPVRPCATKAARVAGSSSAPTSAKLRTVARATWAIRSLDLASR
jgi:hypothetical protein